MYYFSYGSNMSSRRLLARVPSAVKLGVGRLANHELRFHKIGSRDGSAKCDAFETGHAQHVIHGVVFTIDALHKSWLDHHEGLGQGYEVKSVEIIMDDGSVIKAFTYYATNINADLKPFDWYKQHVLIGAKEHGLPDAYIESLAAISVIPDVNLDRQQQELAIYR